MNAKDVAGYRARLFQKLARIREMPPAHNITPKLWQLREDSILTMELALAALDAAPVARMMGYTGRHPAARGLETCRSFEELPDSEAGPWSNRRTVYLIKWPGPLEHYSIKSPDDDNSKCTCHSLLMDVLRDNSNGVPTYQGYNMCPLCGTEYPSYESRKEATYAVYEPASFNCDHEWTYRQDYGDQQRPTRCCLKCSFIEELPYDFKLPKP